RMSDSEFEVFSRAVATKLAALQYVVEIMIANQFGDDSADRCESFGALVADRARSAPPNTPACSRPIDLDEARRQTLAIAAEVEHIFANAAHRIRHPGTG